MKKTLKKITILGLGLCLLSSVPTKANSILNTNEKKIVNEYLDSIISLDLDKAIELSRDNSILYEEQKENLKELTSNPNTKIESFEILDEIKKSDDEKEIIVDLKYLNGTIEQNYVTVINNNGDYKIKRDNKSHKVKKEGIYIPIPQEKIQLLKWDLSTSTSDGNYSRYTKSFTHGAKYVELNYQSLGQNTFRIVKYGYFNDEDISYSANVDRHVGSGKKLVLNIIPGKTFSNVKLRITARDFGNRTFGEIYAY